MEEVILKILSEHGIEVVIIALATNLATGVVKLPIKALAQKMNWDKLLKIIVFLPLIFGFAATTVYTCIKLNAFMFDGSFFALWISATSLSLALYAVFEKLFPSKKKILKDYEIQQNVEAIEKLSSLAKKAASPQTKIKEEKDGASGQEAHVKTIDADLAPEYKKIILKGKNNGTYSSVSKQ